ncbi:MAG: RAMP superfamily CRISPR-associated protein [Burkholderiales bacterium]|nr:RAMP superfamily CRISPR-associated protein [Burkholderiales bacterium]
MSEQRCVVANRDLLSGKKLHLEAFEYEANEQSSTVLQNVGQWLAANALPSDDGFAFFREKIKTDIALLSDTDFAYFAQHATLVEPHVRINDATGTADEGGLFYTENLPPESLLVASLMTSDARREGDDLKAEEVLNRIRTVLEGALLQLGGDATTGRGLVAAKVLVGGTK